MSIDEKLLSAYRFHRLSGKNTGRKAKDALLSARCDVHDGKARYPSSRTGTLFQPWCGIGEAWALTEGYAPTMLRHVEKPEACGLRFVGYADRVAKDAGYSRSIDHTGWFLDEHQDECARGVVYQLSGRNGKALYVAGVATTHNTSWTVWKNGDAPEDGVSIEFDIIEGDPDDDSAKLDAAKIADRIAEIYAEKEREFSEASNAGQQWADLGYEIKSYRGDIMALCKEIRTVRKQGTLRPESISHICNTLRSDVRKMLASIEQAREKRRELESLHHLDKNQRDAFNESAGSTVYA